MNEDNLYLGKAKLAKNEKAVRFETVDLKDDNYLKIDNYDSMDPFFMTVVSDVDFWLFVSSTGGLTAGRKNPETALFPYYTDDKIHDSSGTTGSDTHLLVYKDDRIYLWHPFTRHHSNVYNISRSLYKNTIGNKIVFEERNHDLRLTFRYAWNTSNLYGIVKENELINNSGEEIDVRVLDGIRNILPYGVNTTLQSSSSTLVDGYKRSELLEDYGLGIYTLSSIISDRAEPSECLKATTVWSKGFEKPKYLLSELQVEKFLNNHPVETETDIKGRRGACYVSDDLTLKSGGTKTWYFAAEINQTSSKIQELIEDIKTGDTIVEKLLKDIEKGSENLKKLVFNADGFQMSAKEKLSYRHFSNTLYNIMRGGIYEDGYKINTGDLKDSIKKWNQRVYTEHEEFLEGLDETVNYFHMIEKAEKIKNPDLERLVREYLPLTYSRRHGDPSRPWNKFSIEITKENGEKNLNFEGNWRDIFQNWEALSLSYPGYIESIIAKFVNASTVDGYNPYRITKEGIDWEIIDPADPWSNIGYWGDHQVIYLLKLLEISNNYHPHRLSQLLNKEIFVYGDVPYRIKGFDDLVKDPRNTIVFDHESEAVINERVEKIGSDGKLAWKDEEIYYVNLTEKLLLPALIKLTNFIPEGGIWMNTQRPEWNDANNALVGNGVSMVTLYYLYRYLNFMEKLLEELPGKVMISMEVGKMFFRMSDVFKEAEGFLGKRISDKERFTMISQLGRIGEEYRFSIYENGFSGRKLEVCQQELKEFIRLAKAQLKETIDGNKRQDGLYHSYNLLKFGDHQCSVSHLQEMLEGQVAVLSSDALDSKEAIELLAALKKSSLYRDDQNSYMLYPDRELPKFLEKNRIPEEAVKNSAVLSAEGEKGLARFAEKSMNGHYHFNGKYRNADELVQDIRVTGEYSEEEAIQAGEVFTEIFNHHAFTGRSGTFYKYEGLGCIYWHMVSKLVLAVEESYMKCLRNDPFSEDAKTLREYYYDFKDGIGIDKSPVVYGAFPTDAYSHTPGFAGVQQPGMTGQVKEDIISRFGELGVSVAEGGIHFNPKLVHEDELLEKETPWKLPNKTINLKKNQMGFTFCTVPIIYEKADFGEISVFYNNGDRYTFENAIRINGDISKSIFERESEIDKIIVKVVF